MQFKNPQQLFYIYIIGLIEQNKKNLCKKNHIWTNFKSVPKMEWSLVESDLQKQ